MRFTPRHRSIVATVATVMALVLTSLGNSPANGPAGSGLLVLWALGIAAGVIAFVTWASVVSDIAQQRAEDSTRADAMRPTEPQT